MNLRGAMMHSVGVDIVEIGRIRRALSRWGRRFEVRVFTAAELTRYGGRVPELAARFAAKEAVSKALGTGIRGIAWREIEVLGDRSGKPLILLHGRAAIRAKELELDDFQVSLSHTDTLAVAFVSATGRREERA